MNEIRKPFSEVITEEKMDNLYRRLAYDKDDNDTFFEGNNFINGLALVKSGVRDAYYFDDEVSYIVDTEGKFVDISLDKNIKYSNGEIVTLDESDRGSYFFKVERIWERKFENNKEVECQHLHRERLLLHRQKARLHGILTKVSCQFRG